MRIVFMGTPDFAIPSLRMLHEEFGVVGVITQPDKPKGRGNKLSMPPVKEYAIENGITVLQPAKIRTEEFLEELKELSPDLLVTAAYGKILPEKVLNLPKYGCINVHGSLLPKYRGAAPIHWAIINGELTTGITTMYTDIGLDTGDMLLKSEIEIDEDINVGELHDKMASLGAEVLRDTILKIEDGTIKRIPQDNDDATYAPMVNKDIGIIEFYKSAREVHNLIRGTNPWPGACTSFKGSRMRVWKSKLVDEETMHDKPGKIINSSQEGLDVACGMGTIRILEVQFDNCRRMCVGDYICGHKIDKGEVLG